MKEAENLEGMVLEWSLGLCFICEGDENYWGTVRLQKREQKTCMHCFAMWWSVLPAISTSVVMRLSVPLTQCRHCRNEITRD